MSKRVNQLPTPVWRTASVAFVLAVFSLLFSCAGNIEGTIDPRTLVELDTEPVADAPGAFVQQVVRAVAGRSCSVHPMLLSRERLYDAETEADLRLLGDLASRLCDAGIAGVDAGFDAEGRVDVFGTETGTLRAGRQVFVFEEFDDLTYRAELSPAGSEVACDGFVSAEPDLILHPVDSGSFYLQSDGRLDFVMLVDEYGNERCIASTSYISIDDTSPQYDVYIGWYDVPPSRTNLTLSREVGSSAASVVWTPTNDHSFPVSVANAVESASSRNYNCNGYIPPAPTVSVYVPESFYGGVRVTSSSDPVLYIVGPDGTEYCNDDYSGLNPEVWATYQAGTWDIYVGAFSSGDRFDATLYLE